MVTKWRFGSATITSLLNYGTARPATKSLSLERVGKLHLAHSLFIHLYPLDICLDLPSGQLTNGNVVQTWACQPGNTNQIWSWLDCLAHTRTHLCRKVWMSVSEIDSRYYVRCTHWTEDPVTILIVWMTPGDVSIFWSKHVGAGCQRVSKKGRFVMNHSWLLYHVSELDGWIIHLTQGFTDQSLMLQRIIHVWQGRSKAFYSPQIRETQLRCYSMFSRIYDEHCIV